MVSYFIADLHLSDERPDIVRAFLRFLDEQAPHADALYILGDLFEVWVGDDLLSDTAIKVADALQALNQQGLPIYYICGNRDFLIRQDYLNRSGMTALADETIIDLYGRKTMLLHGDILCTADTDYQRFRKIVHHKWVQWCFLHLSQKRRRRIAANMRAKSKARNSQKSDAIMDVTLDEVSKRFDQHQLDWMIHGHTHRPAIHQPCADTTEKKRIVLGDWYEQRSILSVSVDNFDLAGSKL
ncbi:UDP-2,3-diacylglucosamine diphosphatase [Celerinatantimonas sp. YJH-8]|uniref:UDP-2,3-diacylglucosamine diphosphatase n=1 Tax=Celerinatantimonas sp. YJH-8 TaxID=3228714 RepID=UPI0038C8E5E6